MSESLPIFCGRRKPTLWAKKRRRKSSSRGGDGKNAGGETNLEDDGADGTEGRPKQTTLSGGSPLIFEMARRMLVWDDELYDSQILNDASGSRGEYPPNSAPSSSTEYLSGLSPPKRPAASAEAEVEISSPRWRPAAIGRRSVSNVNPSFRTSAPVMTNAGYAGILRRNSRKKNKPSMWRHTLRVYDKMARLESEAVGKKGVRRGTAHHEAALVAASKLGLWEEALLIYREVEGDAASYRGEDRERGRSRVTDNMVSSVVSACVRGSRVKWTTVVDVVGSELSRDEIAKSAINATDPEGDAKNPTSAANNTSESGGTVPNGSAENTTSAADTAKSSGIMSFDLPMYRPPPRPMIRALTVEERRRPLDAACDVLLSMEEEHGIPLVSRHVNPLAAGYVRLGLRSEASDLIDENLKDRSSPPPPPPPQNPRKSKRWKDRRGERARVADNPGFEGVKLVDWSDDDLVTVDDIEGEEGQLNVHRLRSKDRGSYSLLVRSAVADGDWTGAVRELRRMTDAGLHPNARELNGWSEVMERGCRPTGNGEGNANEDGGYYYYRGGRRRRSWKKKRDGMWLDDLR